MQYFMPSGEIDTNDVMILVIFSNSFFGNILTAHAQKGQRESLKGWGSHSRDKAIPGYGCSSLTALQSLFVEAVMRGTKLLLLAICLLFCIAAVSCDNDREYLPFISLFTALRSRCWLHACCARFDYMLHVF